MRTDMTLKERSSYATGYTDAAYGKNYRHSLCDRLCGIYYDKGYSDALERKQPLVDVDLIGSE